MSKKKELTPTEQIIDTLESYVEYANKTRRFADAGDYQRIIAHISSLEAQLAATDNSLLVKILDGRYVVSVLSIDPDRAGYLNRCGVELYRTLPSPPQGDKQ